MYDSIKTAQSPQFFSQLTGGSNVNTSSGWTRRLVKPWGLLLSLTGKGEMELDGESLKIPEGSLLVYKPGYRYTFRALGEWHYIWFHYPIRNHMIGEMDFNEVLPGLGMQVFEGEELSRIQTELQEATMLEQIHRPGWELLALLLVETALQRFIQREQNVQRLSRDRIKHAVQLLTGNHDYRMDEVASLCGISVPFSNSFCFYYIGWSGKMQGIPHKACVAFSAGKWDVPPDITGNSFFYGRAKKCF